MTQNKAFSAVQDQSVCITGCISIGVNLKVCNFDNVEHALPPILNYKIRENNKKHKISPLKGNIRVTGNLPQNPKAIYQSTTGKDWEEKADVFVPVSYLITAGGSRFNQKPKSPAHHSMQHAFIECKGSLLLLPDRTTTALSHINKQQSVPLTQSQSAKTHQGRTWKNTGWPIY